MSLNTRLSKLEKTWYSLQAEYYSKSWQELYEQDKDALRERQEFDNLIDAATPPFWFWPGKDEWQRKLGWRVTNDQKANALFYGMFERLKMFVDFNDFVSKARPRADGSRESRKPGRHASENKK